MHLTVTRDRYTLKSTTGHLDINGVHECYLLEPPRGDGSGKAPFCILAGTYQGKMEYSHKFKRLLPEIKDVPGRTEIKLHDGNYPKDTEGCGLTGKHRDIDFVGFSDQALEQLLGKLPADFTITYVDTWIDAPEAT